MLILASSCIATKKLDKINEKSNKKIVIFMGKTLSVTRPIFDQEEKNRLLNCIDSNFFLRLANMLLILSQPV